MKGDIFEIIKDATNVYRTPDFIVNQKIEFKDDPERGVAFVSRDTYYRRTPVRDAEYELLFFMRDRVDGRRLPSTMYTRRYVA